MLADTQLTAVHPEKFVIQGFARVVIVPVLLFVVGSLVESDPRTDHHLPPFHYPFLSKVLRAPRFHLRLRNKTNLTSILMILT
jgi:hypothetical protein